MPLFPANFCQIVHPVLTEGRKLFLLIAAKRPRGWFINSPNLRTCCAFFGSHMVHRSLEMSSHRLHMVMWSETLHLLFLLLIVLTVFSPFSLNPNTPLLPHILTFQRITPRIIWYSDLHQSFAELNIQCFVRDVSKSLVRKQERAPAQIGFQGGRRRSFCKWWRSCTHLFDRNKKE